MNLVDVLGAVCQATASHAPAPTSSPSSASTPKLAPSQSSSECGVDTIMTNGTCVGNLPYNWTRMEKFGVATDAKPIQVHKHRHDVSQCLHACEMENGPDASRHIAKRCDRVTFHNGTGTCMLFDSTFHKFATQYSSGTTLYTRG